MYKYDEIRITKVLPNVGLCGFYKTIITKILFTHFRELLTLTLYTKLYTVYSVYLHMPHFLSYHITIQP